jgi:dihydroorotate dehydrogenase (NAD+) catalytic subunit
MVKANMATQFCGAEFRNPIITASGTFGNGKEYSEFFNLSELGGITTKAITLESRQGNKTPRIVETPSGMLNAIGLQNAGIKAFMQDDLPFLVDLAKQKTHVIANISGGTVEEYREIAERLSGHVDFFEVNISCPNVKGEGMAFGQDVKAAAEVTRLVKDVSGSTKVIVKLTPNVTDIVEIAKAVESAGADSISLINTLLGMRINPVTGKFALANRTGGLSGPAIFPVAVRCVYQVSKAVNIPIIGMGGVSSGKDVAEMMRAGATLVSIGTANFIDTNNQAPLRIVTEFEEFCNDNHISSVTDLIGTTY